MVRFGFKLLVKHCHPRHRPSSKTEAQYALENMRCLDNKYQIEDFRSFSINRFFFLLLWTLFTLGKIWNRRFTVHKPLSFKRSSVQIGSNAAGHVGAAVLVQVA